MDQNLPIRTSAATRLSVVAIVALGAACASTPPEPLSSLQAARQAIVTAQRADAGHSAPGELDEARTKLAAADAAVEDKQMTSANRLALESRAAAELATAKTESAKALAVNAQMKSGNVALAEELNRNAGDSQ